MLSGMSASEFSGWVKHFGSVPFSDQLLDAEFATMRALIVGMFTGDSDISAADFSLLGQTDDDNADMSDDELMLAGEGLYGGVRYVPADQ